MAKSVSSITSRKLKPVKGGEYLRKNATPENAASSSKNSRLESLIVKAVDDVRGAIHSMDADQMEIDSLSVEIKASQARTKAILDTF